MRQHLYCPEGEKRTLCRVLPLIGAFLAMMTVSLLVFGANGFAVEDFQRTKWNPIHFKPAIDSARDDECLVCHHAVLGGKPREASPAGVKSNEVLAWYQTLDTYQGEQDTFHRRHMVTPMARQLMDMKCTTCHQGSDPREQSPASDDQSASFTLRKTVNPKNCQMCHGQFNHQVMNLPGPWHEAREGFGNNCLLCHDSIRTNRHRVNFLKADAIEKAGKESGDSCYGCHGGRSWYRTSFPYPRHAWPGMDKETPAWATDRPTTSAPRFLTHLSLPDVLANVPAAAVTPAVKAAPAVKRTTPAPISATEKGKKK